MNNVTPTDQYRFLVESLRLIAAPADDQLRALPDIVLVTDEIVLTFGDSMLLVPQLERAGLIKPAGCEAIQRVDVWCCSMPTDGTLIDASTLGTHDFWERGRVLATQALRALGEEVCAPALFQVAYVKGGR